MDTHLTEAQLHRWRARWRDDVGKPANTELAKSLAPLTVVSRRRQKRKTLGTWIVDLSRFFAGNPAGLKAILLQDHVADVVARGVGLADAAALRAELHRVRGLTADGPLDVRIPGFEEHGPVLAHRLFHPYAQGSQGGFTLDGESMPLVPLTMDALIDACLLPGPARCLHVRADPGRGKSTLLRALCGQLSALGLPHSTDPAGQADVLVIDDFDQRPHEAQTACEAWLETAGQGRMLVCSTLPGHPGPTGACERLRLELGSVPPHELPAIISSLNPILEQQAGTRCDAEAVLQWFMDEPAADTFLTNHRTLGFALRAFADGVTPGPSTLPRLARARLLAGVDNPVLGSLFRICGDQILLGIATKMLASGSAQITEREAAQAVARATSAASGCPVPQRGIFDVVTHLANSSLFRRQGDLLDVLVPEAVMACAAPDWQAHLATLATHPNGGAALECAAANTPDAVLAALAGLPPESRCQAFPAITRVLASGTRFQDAYTWVRLFRECATWWAHGPERTIGVVERARRPASDRIGRHSPITVLSIAAAEHAELLPDAMAPLTPSADLSDPLRAWLEIHAVPPPSEETLSAVLHFILPTSGPGAPRLPEGWSELEVVQEAVPGLAHFDVHLWWRRALVPTWRAWDDGHRHIAGCAPGSSPALGLTQDTTQGRATWLEALSDAISRRDPDAADAIAQAVSSALERGGPALQSALHVAAGSWLRHRRRIAPSVLRELKALAPQSRWDSDRPTDEPRALLTHILRNVLVDEQRDTLWRLWASNAPEEVPWRSFLDAGHDPHAVADWALALATPPKPVGRAAIRQIMAPEPDSPRNKALRALARMDDVELTLKVAVHETLPFSVRQIIDGRMRTWGARDHMRLRLEAAVQCESHAGIMIVGDMLPDPSLADLWGEWHQRTTSIGTQLARLAQFCAGGTPGDRWEPLLAHLRAIEAEVARLSEEGRIRALMTLRFIAGAAHHVARDDLEGPEDRTELVRYLVHSPLWSALLDEHQSPSIWPLAWRLLPRDDLLEALAQDARGLRGVDLRSGRIHALATAGRLDDVEALLHHEELGPVAATALRNVRYRDLARPLALLQARTIQAGPDRAPTTRELFAVGLAHDEAAALHWLDEAVAGLPRRNRLAWWALAVQGAPSAPTRAKARSRFFTELSAAPSEPAPT